MIRWIMAPPFDSADHPILELVGVPAAFKHQALASAESLLPTLPTQHMACLKTDLVRAWSRLLEPDQARRFLPDDPFSNEWYYARSFLAKCLIYEGILEAADAVRAELRFDEFAHRSFFLSLAFYLGTVQRRDEGRQAFEQAEDQTKWQDGVTIYDIYFDCYEGDFASARERLASLSGRLLERGNACIQVYSTSLDDNSSKSIPALAHLIRNGKVKGYDDDSHPQWAREYVSKQRKDLEIRAGSGDPFYVAELLKAQVIELSTAGQFDEALSQLDKLEDRVQADKGAEYSHRDYAKFIAACRADDAGRADLVDAIRSGMRPLSRDWLYYTLAVNAACDRRFEAALTHVRMIEQPFARACAYTQSVLQVAKPPYGRSFAAPPYEGHVSSHVYATQERRDLLRRERNAAVEKAGFTLR